MIQSRAYLLDPNAARHPLYTSWSGMLTTPPVVVDSYGEDWIAPPDAGVVVSAQHYSVPEVSILRRLTAERRVPVLVLADGILEYRNTFDHPGLPPGAIFQPVLGHKIACLGRSQVRMLESWGNLGRCEVVGAPRMDCLTGRIPRARRAKEPFQVLIATACTPAFSPHQGEKLRAALTSLHDWFARHPALGGVQLRPIWRLTQNWMRELAIKESTPRAPLAEVLQQVDAVITTPSTVMLEGMLQKIPVALLDFNNCPHYVPAAWTISAPQQIDEVISELLGPPAAKWLYQDTILHDALECRSPAAPRMARLAEAMIRCGDACRAMGQPLKLPRRILADEQEGHHLPEERFDMRALYPEHDVFANLDRVALQVEVGHLRKELRRVVTELEYNQRRLKLLERREATRESGPALRLLRKLRDMGGGRKSA